MKGIETKEGFTLRACNNCNKPYYADNRNLKRGWGLCCSKSCAAKKRETSKPNYNPERVERNNERRPSWGLGMVRHTDPYYGEFRGRYTSEGYKIYGNTAIDEWGEPVYDID